MGRTANTHEGISKERAHVHFELNLLVNDRFSAWYAANYPGQRNDHGEWNGQNLNGIDPRLILLEEQSQGSQFQRWSCFPAIRNAPLPRVRPEHQFPLGPALRAADQAQPGGRKGGRGRLRTGD